MPARLLPPTAASLSVAARLRRRRCPVSTSLNCHGLLPARRSPPRTGTTTLGEAAAQGTAHPRPAAATARALRLAGASSSHPRPLSCPLHTFAEASPTCCLWCSTPTRVSASAARAVGRALPRLPPCLTACPPACLPAGDEDKLAEPESSGLDGTVGAFHWKSERRAVLRCAVLHRQCVRRAGRCRCAWRMLLHSWPRRACPRAPAPCSGAAHLRRRLPVHPRLHHQR